MKIQLRQAPRGWLRFLALIFLLLSLLGWVRCQQTLQNWSLLASWGIQPGPAYIAFSGAVWGITGLPAAVGLWWLPRWGVAAARVAALVFPLTFWADRLAFQVFRSGMPNWPFALAMTVAWFIFVGLLLPGLWNRKKQLESRIRESDG